MARGTLHSPKPDGARHGRSKPKHDSPIHLTRDGEVRGPSLEAATGRADWAPEVLAWYGVWQRSPQAQVFESTDWARLAMLAPIVAAYWRRPSASALSEIRMSEERLGATVVDRMRARMTIADAEDTPSATLHALPSARESIAARLKGTE